MRLVCACLILVSFASLMMPAKAQSREEAILWTAIQNSSNPDDYRGYLDAFPEGTFAPIAKRRLATLLEAKAKSETLSGSEWGGKTYYFIRRSELKFAEVEEPKALTEEWQFSLAADGSCTFGRSQGPALNCEWKKFGNAVTITAVGLQKNSCAKTPDVFDLTLGKDGTELVGTHSPTCIRYAKESAKFQRK